MSNIEHIKRRYTAIKTKLTLCKLTWQSYRNSNKLNWTKYLLSNNFNFSYLLFKTYIILNKIVFIFHSFKIQSPTLIRINIRCNKRWYIATIIYRVGFTRNVFFFIDTVTNKYYLSNFKLLFMAKSWKMIIIILSNKHITNKNVFTWKLLSI